MRITDQQVETVMNRLCGQAIQMSTMLLAESRDQLLKNLRKEVRNTLEEVFSEREAA